MPFMQREFTLFRVFGLPVKANPSWLFLVALVFLSLAFSYFPAKLPPGSSVELRILLATVGTVGLFASLIVHELCHSLVARKTGMPVAGITLFIFGGVSQLYDEPPTAGAEFAMAVVGPLASVALGGLFLVLWIVGRSAHWSAAALALAQQLFAVNFMLAIFNSLPAFPLDGGRVLRSILWGATGSLRVATRVAASIGSTFGIGLMLLGVFMVFAGEPVGGLWSLVLGFFVRQAAMSSLQMVLLRQQLQGERVGDFMTTDVISVPRGLSVQDFVDRYVFHHRFSYYPVVDDDGRLLGMVGARAPRSVNATEWPATPVSAIMTPRDAQMTVSADTDAVDALSQLRAREESRAVVVADDRPVGILSLRDLLRFLALKIDLEPSQRYR